MPRPSHLPLKPNPFISLRDPKTGKWKVIFDLTIETIRRTAQFSEATTESTGDHKLAQ